MRGKRRKAPFRKKISRADVSRGFGRRGETPVDSRGRKAVRVRP
jgi:hypothetical protein